MAQPAMRPSSSAVSSAASSTRSPRATLIRKADGFIQPFLGPDQVLRVRRGHGQHHHEVGFDQQGAEIGLLELRLDHLDIRVVHQHLHAQRDPELGEARADVPIADDAELAAAQLPAHAHRRLHPAR